MSLAEFKYIYFWEWFHRIIARGFGFLFLLPYIYFYYKRAFRGSEHILLPLILLFIIIQAVIGWYMVQSGLNDRVNVSQYRLAMHLSMAFLILGLLLYLSFVRFNNFIGAPSNKDNFLSICIKHCSNNIYDDSKHTLLINNDIEKMINERPIDYSWEYKRFKKSQTGVSDPYKTI